MNTLLHLKKSILNTIVSHFSLQEGEVASVDITLNTTNTSFGDLSCNAALVLAKKLGNPPRLLATMLQEILIDNANIERIEIAGPGFCNIFLTDAFWETLALDLFQRQANFFQYNPLHHPRKRYLIEFVSANPTGPLHLGHGRNGIIGDVLARVLTFLGHEAHREFLINDAGNQMQKIGLSLKIRCQQALGEAVSFPEDLYAGEYVHTLATTCLQEYGPTVVEKDDTFFQQYAIHHILGFIRSTLEKYRITFDSWFSEKSLHTSGAVEETFQQLTQKNFIYQQDGAWWFRAKDFGDDKDRVIKKSDGSYPYIAPDIAYHIDKFERKFDYLINILGQDHHGYVSRLKGIMKALNYPVDHLHVILYQLVSLTNQGIAVKMSKRKGTFTELEDVIDTVGVDVARFFYLNRKADAHLDFDLAVALKETDENPVYYIHYAYVRTQSILQKAGQTPEFTSCVEALLSEERSHYSAPSLTEAERLLLKKIVSLQTTLHTIEHSHQTHLLSYYTLELAKQFHAYYTSNKVINPDDCTTSATRLFIVTITKETLALCLDLLGLSKPYKM